MLSIWKLSAMLYVKDIVCIATGQSMLVSFSQINSEVNKREPVTNKRLLLHLFALQLMHVSLFFVTQTWRKLEVVQAIDDIRIEELLVSSHCVQLDSTLIHLIYKYLKITLEDLETFSEVKWRGLTTLANMIQQPEPAARHRSQSILSHRTNSTWREDVFGKPRQPRGAMVFTGTVHALPAHGVGQCTTIIIIIVLNLWLPSWYYGARCAVTHTHTRTHSSCNTVSGNKYQRSAD